MIKILILDLDGTLYDNRHRNHLAPRGLAARLAVSWEPWHAACADDTLIEPVAAVARSMAADGWLCYVITRRSDTQRYVTQARLHADKVPFVAAEFASQYDNRPAEDFKADIVRNLRANLARFNHTECCIVALEDDERVVCALEAEGVTTLRVNRPRKTSCKPRVTG